MKPAFAIFVKSELLTYAYVVLGDLLIDLEESIETLDLSEAAASEILPAVEQPETPRSWRSINRAPSTGAGSVAGLSVGGGEEVRRGAAIQTGQFFLRAVGVFL